MHLTQVLNRLKVPYMAAFDPLMVQRSPEEARLVPSHTLMAFTEMEMPTDKLAWRRQRALRDFQSTTA